MQFKELSLHSDLVAGIEDAKFESCMPVQERVFQETLEGRDVYVQSQTGSGKTAAFLITVFEQFKRGRFDRNRAVIIVPTRELAVQIEAEAKVLGGHLPFSIHSFYGGVGYNDQFRMLQNDVDIVIGTPGRLIDLEQRKKLNFRDTSILIIDEADRLFDMGFLPDIQKMIRKMPAREKRMTMLFSATLNTRVWQLAWEHMNDPIQIIMNPENVTVDEVNQEIYHVASSEKLKLLLGLLEREQPENALIFTNTKNEASALSQRLAYNGYQSQFIIGDLPQRKRLHLIEKMKSGDLQILVATDVAARGLHINDLPLVVNFDIPEDPEGYVHRIGRTARAGNTGKAISLACERYVYGLEAIEALLENKIPVARHDDSMLKDDKSKGQFIDIQAGRTGQRNDRGGRKQGGHGGRGPRRGAHGGAPRTRQPTNRSGAGSGKPSRVPAGTSQRSSGGNRATASSPPRQSGSRQNDPRVQRRSQNQARDQKRPPERAKNPNSGKKPRNPAPQKRGEPPKSNAKIEERLEYYRKKYGEDFKLADQSNNSDSKKKSIFKRLFGRKAK